MFTPTSNRPVQPGQTANHDGGQNGPAKLVMGAGGNLDCHGGWDMHDVPPLSLAPHIDAKATDGKQPQPHAPDFAVSHDFFTVNTVNSA